MSVEWTGFFYYDIRILGTWFSYPPEHQLMHTFLKGMGATQSLIFCKLIRFYKKRTDAYFFDIFSLNYVKKHALLPYRKKIAKWSCVFGLSWFFWFFDLSKVPLRPPLFLVSGTINRLTVFIFKLSNVDCTSVQNDFSYFHVCSLKNLKCIIVE